MNYIYKLSQKLRFPSYLQEQSLLVAFVHVELPVPSIFCMKVLPASKEPLVIASGRFATGLIKPLVDPCMVLHTKNQILAHHSV